MRKPKYTPSSKSIAKIKRIFADAIHDVSSGYGTTNDTIVDQAIVDQIRNNKYPYFKYRMSKYCKYTTTILFLLITIIAISLLITSSGTYLSAWFTSIAFAILMLFIISFPQKLVISDTDLEIHSVLEVTKIPLIDITRVQAIDKYRIKRHLPALGSYGFGGFFGYYIDLIHFRIVRMSTTKLTNLILIQTLFNQRHIINCDYRDLFIEILRDRISQARNNNDTPINEHIDGDEEEDDDE